MLYGTPIYSLTDPKADPTADLAMGHFLGRLSYRMAPDKGKYRFNVDHQENARPELAGVVIMEVNVIGKPTVYRLGETDKPKLELEAEEGAKPGTNEDEPMLR